MKKVGIIKRIFALLLIFLLSINSFAAVVSDNDGSAFITKAEFDSLKNNFQAQIDSYNTSIDSKIDGAIAQYLAGIQLSTTTDVPLCGGENFSFVFFTPSVQGNNWTRGRMGINVTETKTAMVQRNGAYDGFSSYVCYRDQTTHPFEALINNGATWFYTKNYQLNYTNSITIFYVNISTWNSYYPFANKELVWQCSPDGDLTKINNKTKGSEGGGLGTVSKYPLRSDWWKVWGNNCKGEAPASSTTNYRYTKQTDASAAQNPGVGWSVNPSFTDNYDFCDKLFFATQGTNSDLWTWKHDITSIATVGEGLSGWTTSTGQTSSLPSDVGIEITNLYGLYSLTQTTNLRQNANTTGVWKTTTSGKSDYSGPDPLAQDYIEPELQMETKSQGAYSWSGKTTYGNLVAVTSGWNAYPYNGVPIVKWLPNWKDIEFELNNTSSAAMRCAISDTQFGSGAWISSLNCSKLKVELDGTLQSTSSFILPVGNHKVKITPNTNITQLYFTAGWSSTTKKDIGQITLPNVAVATLE